MIKHTYKKKPGIYTKYICEYKTENIRGIDFPTAIRSVAALLDIWPYGNQIPIDDNSEKCLQYYTYIYEVYIEIWWNCGVRMKYGIKHTECVEGYCGIIYSIERRTVWKWFSSQIIWRGDKVLLARVETAVYLLRNIIFYKWNLRKHCTYILVCSYILYRILCDIAIILSS